MMFFLNRYEPLGQIKRDEWIRVGKERGVPLFNDAAADVPPAGRFSEYFQQGFDLVAFSGGKAIRGPQSSGLLLGRADLIAAGRQAISPHMGIGRGMKVGKEEIVGLLAAVERFVESRSRRRVACLGNASRRDDRDPRRDPRDDRPGDVPEIANHSPHVVLEWSPWHSALTADDVVRRLRDGDPSIAVLGEGERRLRIAVWTLRDDEHQIVAKQIQQLFKGQTVLSAWPCACDQWDVLDVAVAAVLRGGPAPLPRCLLQGRDPASQLLGLELELGGLALELGDGLGLVGRDWFRRPWVPCLCSASSVSCEHAMGKAAEAAGLDERAGP